MPSQHCVLFPHIVDKLRWSKPVNYRLALSTGIPTSGGRWHLPTSGFHGTRPRCNGLRLCTRVVTDGRRLFAVVRDLRDLRRNEIERRHQSCVQATLVPC